MNSSKNIPAPQGQPEGGVRALLPLAELALVGPLAVRLHLAKRRPGPRRGQIVVFGNHEAFSSSSEEG